MQAKISKGIRGRKRLIKLKRQHIQQLNFISGTVVTLTAQKGQVMLKGL